MKRIHRTLLTAVVALGAGGGAALYAYFGDARHVEERQALEARGLRRFAVDGRAVRGGVLAARGATIAFARDELWGWRLTRPVETPADGVALEALIDRVSELRADVVEVGAVTPEVLARYELDRPRLSVTLETPTEARRLLVGARNALDGRYFVTDGDRRTLWLADPAFHWALDRAAEAFRDKRVFPVAQSAVVALRMSEPSGLRWALRRGPRAASAASGADGADGADGGPGPARSEAEGWVFETREGGAAEPADDGEVNYLLVLLTNRLRAEHWLTDALTAERPGALAGWGLERPALTLELELAGGRRMVGRFGWYRETASDKVTPVLWIEGSTTVIEAPEWAWKDLDRSAAQLRDRLLSRFELAAVRTVKLTLASGARVTAARASAEAPWTLTPSGAAAAGLRIEALLRVASRLRASRLEKERPAVAERQAYGVEPGRERVVFEDAAGTVLADLRFGEDADEGELFLYSATLDRVGRYAQKLRRLVPERVTDLADRAPAADAGLR